MIYNQNLSDGKGGCVDNKLLSKIYIKTYCTKTKHIAEATINIGTLDWINIIHRGLLIKVSDLMDQQNPRQ